MTIPPVSWLQVKHLSVRTHHYSDVFTEQVLAPLEELAYVRLDADTVEKVLRIIMEIYFERNNTINTFFLNI